MGTIGTKHNIASCLQSISSFDIPPTLCKLAAIPGMLPCIEYESMV